MDKKNKKTETILKTTAFVVIALMLFTGIAGAYSNPLPVLFKAQVPPGDWSNSKNCGQASSSMVLSYYYETVPAEQSIKDIDTWLNGKYGDPINNWNGWHTDTTKLETLAREYGDLPNSYKSSGWTIDRVKQEIDAGHPVIVEVDGIYLPPRTYRVHYLVAKGYTSTNIITNDPGTNYGDGATYSNANFAAAMNAQGGRVVVIISKPVTVIFPNGGESWRAGTFHTIKWSYAGNSGTLVNIDLLKGTQVTRIATSVSIGTNGKGSYSWWILQSTGSDYKIRITSNYGYTDTSNGYFSIT
jgi:uncharacterized protein YvpB